MDNNQYVSGNEIHALNSDASRTGEDDSAAGAAVPSAPVSQPYQSGENYSAAPYAAQYGVQYRAAQPQVQNIYRVEPASQSGDTLAQQSYAQQYRQKSEKKSHKGLITVIAIASAAALFCIGMTAGALLRGNTVNNTDNQQPFSLSVSPSPVTDTTIAEGSGEPLTYAQIAAKMRRAVVGINVYASAYGWGSYIYSEGSGFIISTDGYIVTNSHVIQDDNYNSFSITVNIENADGTTSEYEVTVVGHDTRTDLAILKLKENIDGLVVAELGDSTALVLGDEVVAIGNPGGAQFAGSVTNGIVSGVDRVVYSGTSSDSAMKYIQTNAAINPGNSGGPLLNMYGQVIGINSAKIVAEGYEGLGFAIPMDTAKPIIEQLISDGAVIRPTLGMTCSEITEQMAAWYDVPMGLLIRTIDSHSDLNRAGVEVGDIITACEGEKITDLNGLQNIIEKYDVGDTVTLTVFRTGEDDEFTVKVRLVADNLVGAQEQNNYYFNW